MNSEQKKSQTNEKLKNKEQMAINEFEGVIKNYLFPLFDIRGTIKYHKSASENSELISYYKGKEGCILRFYPFIGTKTVPSPFYFEIGTYSSPSLKKPATFILRELLKVRTGQGTVPCPTELIERDKEPSPVPHYANILGEYGGSTVWEND